MQFSKGSKQNQMDFKALSIAGSFLFTFELFEDNRGSFREWFKEKEMKSAISSFRVEQANISHSIKGTIRGLHYSTAPEGQDKLITCVKGMITDVLVDFRVNSPSKLKIEYVDLNDANGKVLFIPSGVGHGFVARSEMASVVYLTSSAFSPRYEKAINPNDSALGIIWPLPTGQPSILSEKDAQAPTFAEAEEAGILPFYA